MTVYSGLLLKKVFPLLPIAIGTGLENIGLCKKLNPPLEPSKEEYPSAFLKHVFTHYAISLFQRAVRRRGYFGILLLIPKPLRFWIASPKCRGRLYLAMTMWSCFWL